MAPEVLRAGEQITAKTDMFSYGMVLLEMACGCDPYEFWSDDEMEAYFMHLKSGSWSLPKKAPRGTTVLGALIAWCTRDVASDRPSAKQVLRVCERQLDAAVELYLSGKN